MQNESAWEASKFSLDARGSWRANRSAVPVTSRLITDRVAKAYSELIAKHARGRLADIGCGDAPLYGMYRNLVDDVVCIDWEASRHEARHVDEFIDLNSDFDIGSGCFDTIVATDVLEHLCEPDYFFNACARALRPSGKLIIGVPFMYWIHEAPHDYHRYTRYSLEYMLQKVELTGLSVEPYGGAPEIVSDIVTKGLGGMVRPLATVVYHVFNAFLAFGPVQRLSEKSSAVMPLGYAVVAQKQGVASNEREREH